MHPSIRMSLPYINFGIASTALLFQITVLYPWHCILDEDFHKLKKEQEHNLKIFHELKLQKLVTIEKRLEKLMDILEKKKVV
jgi:hypothetical protein